MEAASAFTRRPIKARDSRWAAAAAAMLVRRGVTPNAISGASVLCAGVAGLAFVKISLTGAPLAQAMLFILAIVGIQGRLVCNLLDGMVAIEGGRKTKSGEIFNDLPDRISDPLIIVPAGYVITALPYGAGVGWLAALISVLTAYVWVLGHSAGTPDFFTGPMAKQHRMAVLSVACALCVPGVFWSLQQLVLYIALLLIALGGALTVVRRVALIVRALEES